MYYAHNLLVWVVPVIEYDCFIFKYARFPWWKFLDKWSLLYAKGDYLSRMVSIIINKYDSVFLNELINEELNSCNSIPVKYSLNWIDSENYAIHLPDTNNAFNFSKKSLRNLKRLIKVGKFTLQKLYWFEITIDHIVSFEKNSSKSDNWRMIFNDEKTIKLFAELLKVENMFVYQLVKVGVVIAIDVWYKAWNRYFSYYRAYNRSYQASSPWNCLQYLMIDELKNSKDVLLYDFSRWFTSQKKNFANMQYKNFYFYTTQLVRFFIYLRGRSLCLWLVKLIKNIIKKVLKS